MKPQSLTLSQAGRRAIRGWRGFVPRILRGCASPSSGQTQCWRICAVACFLLALSGGLLTAQGTILGGAGSSGNAGRVSSVMGTVILVTGGLGGLAGVVLSLGFGLAGFWSWPRVQRARAVPQGHIPAAYDQVTGLPTLRLFIVLLEQAARHASDLGRSVGVLAVELSQFWPDSTAGASASETLVARVQAARIKSALRSHDTVAYLGDHRFAVLIDTACSDAQILACADHIRRTLSHPLVVAGREVVLSCRIGSAMLSPETASGGAVLDRAVQSLSLASSEHPIHFFGAARQERPAANSSSRPASRAA